MEKHWLDNLSKTREKLMMAQSYLDETAFYCEMSESTKEQLLRLSEHCSKMITHLNALTKLEKEKVNV